MFQREAEITSTTGAKTRTMQMRVVNLNISYSYGAHERLDVTGSSSAVEQSRDVLETRAPMQCYRNAKRGVFNW